MIDQMQIELLNIIGLDIKDNGRLFDQDTNQFLTFNGRYIIVREKAPIIHKGDVEFDPIHNRKLAEYLLNVLICKEKQDNGLYIKMMYINERFDPKNPQAINKKSLVVTTAIDTIETHKYYNYCLACIEMIYLISGTPLSFDLSAIDYTKQQMEECILKPRR